MDWFANNEPRPKGFLCLLFILMDPLFFYSPAEFFFPSEFAEALISTQAILTSKCCPEGKGEGLHHILSQLPPNGNLKSKLLVCLLFSFDVKKYSLPLCHELP